MRFVLLDRRSMGPGGPRVFFSDAGGVTPDNGALRTGRERGNQTVTTCKLARLPTCPDGCELGLGVQVDTFSVPSSWSRFPLEDVSGGGGDDGEVRW